MNSRLLCLALCSFTILSIVQQSCQLECYVCQNQEDNKSKCAETVKICDILQEQCLTEVRWGTKPYWALTSQKQYFISKRCATKQECSEATSDKYHKCDRIRYNDWNCTNCCSGDKCNYFVTLAGHSIQPVKSTFIFISFLVMIVLYHFQPSSVRLSQ